MSISTPPPPTAPTGKKKGLGCFGCGCLVVLAILALIAALFGFGAYSLYHKALVFTSPTASAIPAATVSDDTYQAVKQKVSDFYHDVQNHQPATIQLSGDEITAALMRDPYLSAHHVQIVVAINGDEASVQASIPGEAFPWGQTLMPGRFLNFSTTLGLSFDPNTHMIMLNLHSLQVGDQTMPPDSLAALQTQFSTILNSQLMNNPDGQKLLNQTKSMQLVNGNLIIETQ